MPLHSSPVYSYVGDTGPLDEKAQSLILTELPSHEIKCEPRGINFLNVSKVEEKGVREGKTNLLTHHLIS